MRRALLPSAAALLLTAALTACVPSSSPRDATRTTPATPTPTAPLRCEPQSLPTKTAGTVTWATGGPADEPWVRGNDPASGQGFEAAVAAAVTRRLGFPADRTRWIRGTFDSIVAAGPKSFDIALDQIPITPERGTAVEFSPPYYDVRPAVVALTGNPATKAVHRASDLRSTRLGAKERSAALEAISRAIRPDRPPTAFASSNDAKVALVDGEIDALVVDVPTAYYLTTVELTRGRIVGTLPQTATHPTQFGLVLELGSALAPCVAQAVDALRRDGVLSALENRWLSNAQAPNLP